MRQAPPGVRSAAPLPPPGSLTSINSWLAGCACDCVLPAAAVLLIPTPSKAAAEADERPFLPLPLCFPAVPPFHQAHCHCVPHEGSNLLHHAAFTGFRFNQGAVLLVEMCQV